MLVVEAVKESPHQCTFYHSVASQVRRLCDRGSVHNAGTDQHGHMTTRSGRKTGPANTSNQSFTSETVSVWITHVWSLRRLRGNGDRSCPTLHSNGMKRIIHRTPRAHLERGAFLAPGIDSGVVCVGHPRAEKLQRLFLLYTFPLAVPGALKARSAGEREPLRVRANTAVLSASPALDGLPDLNGPMKF